MKKIITHLGMLIVALTLTITSCKKDDNSSPSSSSTSTAVPSTLTTGSWRVSYYHESNNDHTLNFTGYSFTFSSNGTMTATNSSGTTNGTWNNDDSHSEFHMSIGNSSPLSDISNGWIITSSSSTQIIMKDDNSAHNEELHFTRI